MELQMDLFIMVYIIDIRRHTQHSSHETTDTVFRNLDLTPVGVILVHLENWPDKLLPSNSRNNERQRGIL